MIVKALRDLLYEECKGYDKEDTMLWMTLELLKLKVGNGWSDTSFLALIKLLTKVLPKPNGLPNSTYQAKKIICSLTLGIEKNHSCPNHCTLYKKNTNSKIGVQRAMLVDTNKTITVRRLRMIQTKRAIKGKDERGRIPLPIMTLNGLKREKFSPL
jgi:hypothetical protein